MPDRTSRAPIATLLSAFTGRPSGGVFLLTFLVLLVACGERLDDQTASDWTFEEGVLSLTETLRTAGTDAYFFGSISDIAVRDDGRIYVADGEAMHVKVLNPDGTLRDSIGRAGEGPGEFQQAPSRVYVARDDSLFVRARFRVSVFGPDHAFSRRFRMGFRTASRFLVPPTDTGFVSLSQNFVTPTDTTLSPRAVHRLDATGSVVDTLFMMPSWPAYVHQGGGTTRVLTIRFAGDAHLQTGPAGRIHSGWGDSLTVDVHRLDGSQVGRVEVPFEPVPVTEADLERAVGDIETGPAKTELLQRIPDTKPAFTDFLVDDEGRYWFGRPTAHPDSTDWWVAWPEEKRVATGTLPSDVQLKVVKDGRAYGWSTTEEGAPVVVRYDVSFQR